MKGHLERGGDGWVAMVDEPWFLRPEEAARLLNVSRTKVYELMRTERLPSVKIDGSRRVARVALEDFVAQLGSKRVT